jgi:hypothetical protein
MPAGTIALTNNLATVTGTGTSFTTELKVNDFIVSTVGGLAYTLGVKSIESNTSLTLLENYTGPTASAQAWTPVPYGTMAAITAQLAAQVTYAIRGFNLDKANWQQIFIGTGTVTVTLPDGTSWQGPAWNGITSTLADKMDKSGGTFTGEIKGTSANFSGNATFSGGAFSGGVNIGDAGNNKNYVSSSNGTLELYSDNPFIDFHFANASLDYVSRIINDSNTSLMVNFQSSISTGGGLFRVGNGGYGCKAGSTGAFSLYGYNLNWTNPGSGSQMALYVGTTLTGYISTTSTSDKELKKDIHYRADNDIALSEVMKWKPATFKYKARGIIEESDTKLGFIANDLVQASPECVMGEGLPDDYDIEQDPNRVGAYSLDQVAMIAKLTMAIQAQQDIIDSQNTVITELQKRMKAIDGLEA